MLFGELGILLIIGTLALILQLPNSHPSHVAQRLVHLLLGRFQVCSLL